MNNVKIVVPSTEDVKKLLVIAMNDKMLRLQNIGELLGMKWVDSLLPKCENEPEWGFEGLKIFFEKYEINGQDTFVDALKKLDKYY